MNIKTTLDARMQWDNVTSAYSRPLYDLANAIAQVQFQTMHNPKCVMFTASAWRAFRRHPDATAYFKSQSLETIKAWLGCDIHYHEHPGEQDADVVVFGYDGSGCEYEIHRAVDRTREP